MLLNTDNGTPMPQVGLCLHDLFHNGIRYASSSLQVQLTSLVDLPGRYFAKVAIENPRQKLPSLPGTSPGYSLYLYF